MPEKHDNRRPILLGLTLSVALFVGGLVALPGAQPKPQQQQATPAAAPIKKSVPKVMCHKSDPAVKQKAVNN